MARSLIFAVCTLAVGGTLAVRSGAEAPTSIERGRQALQERAFNPPFWSKSAYQALWKQWPGVASAPADYSKALIERYGLHTAPYPNRGYPMGLRENNFLLNKGIANDCMLCHGGSIFGKSLVGLGNSTLDMQALFEELNLADGRKKNTPFVFCNVRGTNEAGGMGVYLLGYRNPDLDFLPKYVDLDLRDDLCEDVPAWWLLKKKKTMYYTGGADARSVRSLMQFMLHPLNSAEVFKREEATFVDIQAYLLALEAPKYPLPVDRQLAAKGEVLFRNQCAKCHGTYGSNSTYPNKIVPIDRIGTDRIRFQGIAERFGRQYNRTWFAKEKNGWLVDGMPFNIPIGYQAPPLDGIWATAPYFHNGSAPTVYDVLNSKKRPAIYTRSFRTGQEDYDSVKLGWKVRILNNGPDPKAPEIERRKIYDTRQSGRGNGGHTFGDALTDEERFALIEYLKTL